MKTYILFLLAALFLLPSERNSLAQEECRSGGIKIQLDPEFAPLVVELTPLMESHEFAKAEEIAREKNADPRIIAMIMAHAGKKEEAFAMFCDVVKSAAESDKIEIARQCRDILSYASLNNTSLNLGDEFFRLILRKGLVPFTQDQRMCEEVMLLIREKNIEGAKRLFDQLLDTDYAEKELTYVAMMLITSLGSDISNRHIISRYVDKLQKKFPDDLRFKLQSIDLLLEDNPSLGLAKLEQLRNEHPEFYLEMEQFILLMRGRAFEKLGEMERAKSAYSELLGTGFEDTARIKIDEYEAREKAEKEWQEKLAESNRQQQHNITPPDIVPRSPHRFWTILTVNVIFLAVIAYLIYRRNRRRL